MDNISKSKISLTKKGLIESFKKQLPGVTSHLKMAPDLRKDEILKPPVNSSTCNSSVLILLFPENETIKTVLIKRPDYNGVHSGQISFPGGKSENNESSVETALRETKEELGINPGSIQVIGGLTPLYIPPSNFLVKPYVGLMSEVPVIKPDKFEVDGYFKIDLSFFLNNNSITHEIIKLSNGLNVKTPCYNYNGNIVWGATAMIMKEFVDLLT